MSESMSELDKPTILEYANYKDLGGDEDGDNADNIVSNASKEEYSVINLALMLSNEKKLKYLLSMVKNDLQSDLENNSTVLKVNIRDPSISMDTPIEIPKDNDTLIVDADDNTSKHFDVKIKNEEL